MASCMSVLSLVIHVFVLVAAGIGHFTTYWVEHDDSRTNATVSHQGLWQACNTTGCHWTGQSSVPAWLATIRIVHACAVANAIVALVTAMSYMCCACCLYSIRGLQFNILVLVVGFAESVAVVAIYAVKYRELVSYDDGWTNGSLSWSFFVAAGGALCFALAIICTVCETANAKRRTAYQPLEPTNRS